MTKLVVLVCLFLIGMVWCACDSCGTECARACGTRRFRACCFNYLRRKRGPAVPEFWTDAEENLSKKEVPAIVIRYVPEDVLSEVLADLRTSHKIQH